MITSSYPLCGENGLPISPATEVSSVIHIKWADLMKHPDYLKIHKWLQHQTTVLEGAYPWDVEAYFRNKMKAGETSAGDRDCNRSGGELSGS